MQPLWYCAVDGRTRSASKWEQYSGEFSEKLEQAYQNLVPASPLLEFRRMNISYLADVRYPRCQINTLTKTERVIRRRISKKRLQLGERAVWYSRDPQSFIWIPYTPKNQKILEVMIKELIFWIDSKNMFK